MSKLPDFLIAHLVNGNDQAGSGATSPGAEWREDEGDQHSRYRPRTYPYHRYLPYEVEDEAERQRHLDEIVRNLYIAIESRDFAPGAVRWTRELRGWLGLKFDPPRKTRAKLVRLYYELALAPGMDTAVAERFANMFMTLTKRKHYLHPGKDLSLDWRPLYKELKSFVLPQESGFVHSAVVKKPLRTLTRMCSFAQFYFDPDSLTDMFEEFLPYFTTSNIEGAFAVVGLLNLLMPTGPPPPENPKLQPTYYLPTLFNLWSMISAGYATRKACTFRSAWYLHKRAVIVDIYRNSEIARNPCWSGNICIQPTRGFKCRNGDSPGPRSEEKPGSLPYRQMGGYVAFTDVSRPRGQHFV